MGRFLRLQAFVLFGILSACGQAEPVWSTDERVEAARFVSSEAPYVSLMTMVRKSDDFGAHSALIVNGSEVVLFDPAGTFKHPQMPERNDVFFGVTPGIKSIYEKYHARQSTYVIEQKLPISRDLADKLIVRILAQGASAKMYCGVATSDILRDFEVFASVPKSFYPTKLMDGFGAIPEVIERRVDGGDLGQNLEL